MKLVGKIVAIWFLSIAHCSLTGAKGKKKTSLEKFFTTFLLRALLKKP
jgi:hypothetical protein